MPCDVDKKSTHVGVLREKVKRLTESVNTINNHVTALINPGKVEGDQSKSPVRAHVPYYGSVGDIVDSVESLLEDTRHIIISLEKLGK